MITALAVLLAATMAFSPTPADELMTRMMLIEIAQDGDMGSSSNVSDHHQCRQFQADSFAEASAAYMLAAYPEAMLFLPTEHEKAAVSGRPVGACWAMPAAATGNAFVEAARFDYDQTISQKENLANAMAFLENVRAGDLMQMLGRYSSGGRGTHTILITRPYDPRDDKLYWCDSNFATRSIDGVRHGVVYAHQAWNMAEVAGWLASEGNSGATLYRLRDDIVSRTVEAKAP